MGDIHCFAIFAFKIKLYYLAYKIKDKQSVWYRKKKLIEFTIGIRNILWTVFVYEKTFIWNQDSFC